MDYQIHFDRPLHLTYDPQDVKVSAASQSGMIYAKRARILLLDAYKLIGSAGKLRIELLEGREAQPLRIDFGEACCMMLTHVNDSGAEEQISLQATVLTFVTSMGVVRADDELQSVVPAQSAATPLQPHLEHLLMLKEDELYRFLMERHDQLNSQLVQKADEIDELKRQTDQMEAVLQMRQTELEQVKQRMESRRSAMSNIDAQIMALAQAEIERQAAVKGLVNFDHAALATQVMEQQEMIEVRRKAAMLYGDDASRVLNSVPERLKQAAELVKQADEVLRKVINIREEINCTIVSALDRRGCVEAAKLKGGEQYGTA